MVTRGRTIMSDPTTAAAAKFKGVKVDLPGLGRLELTQLYTKTTETAIYRTENPGIVVKVFDLDAGGRPDEVAYGPYTRFQLELANFEDIMNLEALRRFVPIYYGANIVYEKK